jgi:hypothetical protein
VQCDFFRPCSICTRMRVDCTANGSDPKSRAKYEPPNPISLGQRTNTRLRNHRRRKSSAAASELISASIREEIVTVPCPETVTDARSSVCFSEPRDDVRHHSEAHSIPNENGVTDTCRIEYVNDVSDESGSWHPLEKSTSRSSRPDGSSQSPRSALAEFGYAESAVGISKKASSGMADPARSIMSDELRFLNFETTLHLYAQHMLSQAETLLGSIICP